MSVDAALDVAITDRIAAALEPLIGAIGRLSHDPTPGVWTAEEAATVLGTSAHQVRKWVAQGLLATLPEIDRVLIPKQSVTAFIERAAQQPQRQRRRAS